MYADDLGKVTTGAERSAAMAVPADKASSRLAVEDARPLVAPRGKKWERKSPVRRVDRILTSRPRPIAQVVLFAVVGSTGVVVDLTVFTLSVAVMPLIVSRALGIWAAMTWNFNFNRRVTFAGQCQRPIVRQYILFCGSCGIGALISISIFGGLQATSSVFASHPVAAACVGILMGTISNFTLSKHVAFK